VICSGASMAGSAALRRARFSRNRIGLPLHPVCRRGSCSHRYRCSWVHHCMPRVSLRNLVCRPPHRNLCRRPDSIDSERRLRRHTPHCYGLQLQHQARQHQAHLHRPCLHRPCLQLWCRRSSQRFPRERPHQDRSRRTLSRRRRSPRSPGSARHQNRRAQRYRRSRCLLGSRPRSTFLPERAQRSRPPPSLHSRAHSPKQRGQRAQ